MAEAGPATYDDSEPTHILLGCWVGDQPLIKVFPWLAALEEDIDCKVGDRWSSEGWVWRWRQPLVAGVSHAFVAKLCELLQHVKCSNNSDTWRWGLDEDGVFSVGTTRKWIENKVLPANEVPTRWCKVVPRKVNILVWRLRLWRLPTRVRLRDRGITVPFVLCPVYGRAEEDLKHLLFRCVVAEDLWRATWK
ncbi:hypothetical protein LXL04_015089 [Taraxacum kok-saghyz]